MRPNPSFAHGGYKPHGNVETFGKCPTGPVLRRCGTYLPNVGLRQLGRWHSLPISPFEVGAGPPMGRAFCNTLRRFASPVVIAPRHFGHYFGRQFPPLRSPAMPFSVARVFLSGRPVEIFRNVVAHVAVPVRAVWLVGWLGAIERLADKAVHLAGNLSIWGAQDMRKIAPAMLRWDEKPAREFTLPIRDITANPTDTRNRIIGSFGYCFPRFSHGGLMTSIAYNVKLLTRRRAAEAMLYRKQA